MSVTDLQPESAQPIPLPDVIDAAARIVEGNGLHTGNWWLGAGPVLGDAWRPGLACCTVGALAVALGHTDAIAVSGIVACDEDPDGPVHPAVAAMLVHLGLRTAGDLYRWSDEHAESGRAWVVVAALRACAAELRQADQAEAEQDEAEQP